MTIGALQGIAGWTTDTYILGRFLPHTLAITLFYAVLGGGLCAQLLLKNPLNIRGLLAASGMGILFGATSWWSFYQARIPFNGEDYSFVDAKIGIFMHLLLLAYILIPYLQNYCNKAVRFFDYNDLYKNSWDNFFIVSIGMLVAGIFWLLIFLWAELFEMIKIRIFSNIFYSKPFFWIAPFAIAGLGITIGIRNEKIIESLRNIALAICKFMMPLTALITIIFTATLPFSGLQAIWDTKHSTPILLTLIAANVFFINGIFQNGTESNYPSLLKKFSNLSLLMLPILVIIAAYSTWLRIDQYGLTPDRIYSSLIILVGSCYSFSYAFSAIQRNTQWLINIKKPNIYIGILICTLIALTHSPVLDPLTISARNQYNRLVNNKMPVEKFDFGALRYELGKPGLSYLKKVRELQKHESLAAIQEKLKILDSMKSRYEWSGYQRSGEKPQAPAFEILGGEKAPAGLVEEITKNIGSSGKPNVYYLLLKDINNDNQHEAIIWNKYDKYANNNATVWGMENGKWVTIGHYNTRFARTIDIKQLSAEYNAELQTPEYQDLKIGNIEWKFRKNSSD